MKRLFIAVPVREMTKKQISQGIIASDAAKKLPVRWTAIYNLHLTLQFLGDVEENRIQLLTRIMDRIPKPDINEVLRFTNIGAFPNNSAPRIIWLGISQNEALQKYQRQLTSALIEEGFAADRKKYKPHLTLGRVRDNAVVSADAFTRLGQLREGIRIDDSPLEHVILFESLLKPGGPVYTELYNKNTAS